MLFAYLLCLHAGTEKMCFSYSSLTEFLVGYFSLQTTLPRPRISLQSNCRQNRSKQHLVKVVLLIMEACCSFKSIVGSPCGYDAKDRKRQTKIIPLLSCSKDITRHLSSHRFSGIKNEIDLILFRVAWFDKSKESIESMTICPHHRAVLGISWTRGGDTRCRVPQGISGHGKSRDTWPKGDRGIWKQESKMIFRNTGVFVAPGSGNCVCFFSAISW